MSLQREAELGRSSAHHLLRSADENLKAKEEMILWSPVLPSQPWAVPGPPGTDSSWQRMERDLQAAKAVRAFPSHLTTFSAPWGTVRLLCGLQKPGSAKGLSLAHCRCQSKRWIPQEAASGLSVRARAKESFFGGDFGMAALWHESCCCRGIRRGWRRDFGGDNSVLGFSTLDLHFFAQFSLSALWQDLSPGEEFPRNIGGRWLGLGLDRGTIRCEELIPILSSCQWHNFNKRTLPSSSSFKPIMGELWYFTRQEQCSELSVIKPTLTLT